MRHKIKNEIKENKQYLYLSYLISILTIIPQAIASESNDFEHFIFLLIILFVMILVSKFNKLLFALFIIYMNVTNIIISHIYMHWGYCDADIGPRIEVSAASPVYETLEYLKTYIDYRDILLFVYTFFVLFLLYKLLVHYKHSFKIIRFLGFILGAAVIAAVYYYYDPFEYEEPFNIPNKCITAEGHSQLYNERTKYLASLQQEFKQNDHSLYDKIVVIQGESVNKHHMAIYNYDENTTPFLSSLKDQNKLYVFNAIAPTNQTRYSIPILHTKANVHNFSDAFIHSRSIVGDFKMHRYKTYWISNQGEAGEHDSSIASMAQEADVYHFENLDFMTAQPDEVLLSYINHLQNSSQKEMYFIHLMGSHADYERRYSYKQILFKDPSNVAEDYDNTIFYTDYILKSIFTYFTNTFPNQKILFVYISDHGEVVSEKEHGHGYLPPFKDEYDVPFVIYSNVKNSRIDELYKNNKKGVFNLENLNYMIEYISGVNDENNISYSKDVFALEPKNIVDYNKLPFYDKKP